MFCFEHQRTLTALQSVFWHASFQSDMKRLTEVRKGHTPEQQQCQEWSQKMWRWILTQIMWIVFQITEKMIEYNSIKAVFFVKYLNESTYYFSIFFKSPEADTFIIYCLKWEKVAVYIFMYSHSLTLFELEYRRASLCLLGGNKLLINMPVGLIYLSSPDNE